VAERLRPTLEHERALWSDGHRWVAGFDEVGRGAWAGPVTVGIAVVSPSEEIGAMPEGLCDSKLVPEARREELFSEVAAWCDAWAVGHAQASECDRYGMTAALRLAGLRALGALRRRMDAVLIDGPHDLLKDLSSVNGGAGPVDSPRRLPWSAVQADFDDAIARIRRRRPPKVVVPVIDGDARCAAVAAASILAKVVRDRLMREESDHFPGYEFHANKGYPSPAHVMALRGYGLTSIHRRTWAFVDELYWLTGTGTTNPEPEGGRTVH